MLYEKEFGIMKEKSHMAKAKKPAKKANHLAHKDAKPEHAVKKHHKSPSKKK